jgi:hypothetical protein
MREPSSLTLNKGEKDLLAGLEQEMVLTLCAGSYTIAKVKIVFKCCVTKRQQLSVHCWNIIIATCFYLNIRISGYCNTNYCIGII